MKTRTTAWVGRLVLAGLLCTLGAASGSAATICVNPAGTGGCFTAIQAGVNAAAAGDTVKVGPGTYYEAVVVSGGKTGLQIVGAGKTQTIIDPDAYAPSAVAAQSAGIAVGDQNVQIKNLTVRNGPFYGVTSTSNGTVVQGVNVTGARVVGIDIFAGWNSRIVDSEVHDTREGILSGGFGTIIKNTTISGCSVGGIEIFADGAQITGNKVTNTSVGVFVLGNGTVVKGNDVRYQSGTGGPGGGIHVSGIDPAVQQNRVFGTSGIGIEVDCTTCFGGSVLGNSVSDTGGYGILATSDNPGLLVQKNVLVRTGLGLSLNGTGILASSNRATDVGISLTGSCFETFGNENSLNLNTAANCTKAGFYVSGSNMTLTSNTATATIENGFTVDGSAGANANNTLTKNRTTLDAGQGFALVNTATNTTLVGNSATKNRVDYCHEGDVGTVTSGNTFGTTDVTCPIIH